MSSGWAAVRFPDGTVKACIYNGTSDILVPRLYDTTGEAWEARKNGADAWPDPEGEPEPVIVYSDYGGGFWWEAKATRNTVLPDFCDPFGVCEDQSGRLPHGRKRAEVHDEVPAWVTEWLASQE